MHREALIVARLGADLRALRKTRGLTLEALASQLDCSVGWLSQVERDISSPDPQDVSRLARALDVPMSILDQSAPAREEGRLVRNGHHRAIGERAKGLTEMLLSPDLTDAFQVIHSVFAPGAERREPVVRPTQEVAYLMVGRLDIWLDENKFTVTQGDSFRVRDQALKWANPYDRPATLIWVISPPVY